MLTMEVKQQHNNNNKLTSIKTLFGIICGVTAVKIKVTVTKNIKTDLLGKLSHKWYIRAIEIGVKAACIETRFGITYKVTRIKITFTKNRKNSFSLIT